MFSCTLFGEALAEFDGPATCSFCGATEEAEYICKNQHYVCEDCRLANQEETIERVCFNTKSNPIQNSDPNGQ